MAEPLRKRGTKPPKIMRLPSKGMSAGGIRMRGSAINFLLHSSRASREARDDPGKDDGVASLCLHGHMEVGELAVGNVVAPALDDFERAVLLEDRRRVRGHLLR